MPRLIAAALLAAACAVPPAPAPAPAFRNARAPIWSAAALDPARLAGTWRQAAAFAAPGAAPCQRASVAFGPQGTHVTGTICGADGPRAVASRVATVGPGRFSVAGEAAPWWVLWLDADARTLVIGTPDGRFGAVFDRGAIPADRLAAARAVLDWNGYDLSRLVILR